MASYVDGKLVREANTITKKPPKPADKPAKGKEVTDGAG